jgi:predicted membrane protein
MSETNNTNGRIWLGAALIILGSLFFLRNFHFNLFNFNIFSWPFLLLVIGIVVLVNHKDSLFGLILIVVGSVGIASNYFDLSFRSIIFEYWPFLIIIIGIYTILKSFGSKTKHDPGIIEENNYYLDIFSLFGDKTKIIRTNNFLGGKLTSIFSDLKVTLKESNMDEGIRELDTLTIFGATQIFLPEDWEVIIKTTTLFGGFEDQRFSKKNTPDAEVKSKTLVVKGLVLFGSGEIKS